MPRLEELYLASNVMTALSGWETLPMLRVLHLRKNKIEKIDEELPPLDELVTLNLRNNGIKDLENALRVFMFPKLTEINLLNNPIERESSSLEVLMADFLIKKPSITRFCKIKVIEAHKLHAVY